MFFLDDLKALSTLKLQKELRNSWRNDSFPECVREIYETTPDSDRAMRSAVVEVARAHTQQLGEVAVFRALLREGGDFAVDFTYPEPLDVVDPFDKLSALCTSNAYSDTDTWGSFQLNQIEK